MPGPIEIDDDLRDRVRELAEQKRQSIPSLLSEAIRQYLDREELNTPFIQEARASWNDYQQTGLHLTHSEVDQWLASWGTEDEDSVPPCHK